MLIFHLISMSSFQSLGLALGLALWQQPSSARPQWLTYAFLIALILTIFFFRSRFPGPGPKWLTDLLANNLILIGFLATTVLFFVILFNLNPFPLIRSGAEAAGLGQLVNFDTAFANGLPDAVSDNIGVVSVMRTDTDADGFEEWVVFYQFDKRARNSPIHAAVYDNDRGKPPVIFPYQLQAPDRNYLSEQQPFGPALTVANLALDHNGPNGADVPELIVQGGNELTIFRFQQNSELWDYPRDIPARYQPIGFFRGNGGVSINLTQSTSNYGQVTVIDRNGYERSQLVIRSVYGLKPGSDGNQTYLDPIPPLGGVDGPQLAAPILSTVDFYPAPPDELFNTPFPEKLVMGFYAATCGGADGSLCNSNTTSSSLLWRPDGDTSLGSFLTGDALAAFNNSNPGYFDLPAFSGNSGITVAQLVYYPQFETDPDLLATGGGRDVVTGEQGQIACVGINFKVNGSALQKVLYLLQLTAGQWKIMNRLPDLSPVCGDVPQPPNKPQPPVAVGSANPNPQTASPGQAVDVHFSGEGSTDPDGNSNELQYLWTFPDGTKKTEKEFSIPYIGPGQITATLTVTDVQGLTGTTTVTTNIPPPPTQNPIANPNGPYEGTVCQEIEFSGNGSVDPDGGQITNYRWDFGDGVSDSTQNASIGHTYHNPGNYTVSLVVTDDESQTSDPPATTTVIVNLPPTPPCGQPTCCW